MLTTGRKLDEQGQPIPGTGFEFDGMGPIGVLIGQRTSPLYSDPITGEWAFFIRSLDESGATVTRNVHVFRPRYPGPPEHEHPNYDEHFEVILGVLRFTVEGQEREAPAGESLMAPRGARHTFWNPRDEISAMVIQSRPEGSFDRMIQSVFGMAHEGRLGDGKRPPFWDSMALLVGISDDMIYSAPPLRAARILASALAPVTRKLGHVADEPRYHEAAFWEARVEQPGPAAA